MKPTKSNWTLQRCHRDWTKIVETLYDLLDSGKSFEELGIHFDIGGAGGAIPEELRDILHDALEEITKAREAGLNRSEVLVFMRAGAKR
jgi:hypothetical protein